MAKNVTDASGEYKMLKDMVERLTKDFNNVIKNANLSKKQKDKALKRLKERMKETKEI